MNAYDICKLILSFLNKADLRSLILTSKDWRFVASPELEKLIPSLIFVKQLAANFVCMKEAPYITNVICSFAVFAPGRLFTIHEDGTFCRHSIKINQVEQTHAFFEKTFQSSRPTFPQQANSYLR